MKLSKQVIRNSDNSCLDSLICEVYSSEMQEVGGRNYLFLKLNTPLYFLVDAVIENPMEILGNGRTMKIYYEGSLEKDSQIKINAYELCKSRSDARIFFPEILDLPEQSFNKSKLKSLAGRVYFSEIHSYEKEKFLFLKIKSIFSNPIFLYFENPEQIVNCDSKLRIFYEKDKKNHSKISFEHCEIIESSENVFQKRPLQTLAHRWITENYSFID